MTLPVLVSHLHQQLAAATTPRQTHAIEAASLAEQAWAREQQDYDGFVKAALLYIMARRKTTELIQPYIHHGRPEKGNIDATFLTDFGLTRQQWHTRAKELEITEAQIAEYFAECIDRGWWPSRGGLIKRARAIGAEPTNADYERENLQYHIRAILRARPLVEWNPEKQARFSAAQDALREFAP